MRRLEPPDHAPGDKRRRLGTESIHWRSGQARDDTVGQMRGALHHAAGGAGGAHAPTFTGLGDQEVVSARSAAATGEAVGEDAAVEVAAEFTLGGCGRARPGAIILKRQPGGKMGVHRAIEQCALGLATA